jgi:hypothetical protein
MFGYISRQTSSVGAQPRPDVTFDATADVQPSRGGTRQALGLVLVSLGQRVAGEAPVALSRQAEGDCA